MAGTTISCSTQDLAREEVGGVLTGGMLMWLRGGPEE